MWARLRKTSPQALYKNAKRVKTSDKEMTDPSYGELYIFILWFFTVEFLKIVWLLYILFLIWLIIHYVNNYCIEINFK